MWTECELNNLDKEDKLLFTEKKKIIAGKMLAFLVNKVMQNRIIGSQFSLIKITFSNHHFCCCKRLGEGICADKHMI